MRFYFTSLFLMRSILMALSLDEITLDGNEYISSSLIASPTNKDSFELGILFRTSLSSCVLFYASGISGDYIALELIRGSLRYVANSAGLESKSTIEIIHTEKNYADGNLHQVNIDIGESTKLYTYSLIGDKLVKSKEIVKYSTAIDRQYDLDENAYFMGLPITERIYTKEILLSNRNFEGCLNVISFISKEYNLSIIQSGKHGMKFNGNFKPGCTLKQPTFLKSFSKASDELKVYSHDNDKTFFVELYYRTYLQNGVLMRSVSSKKSPTLVLLLVNNSLHLDLNLTKNLRVQLFHYNKQSDDGIWRRITVQVSHVAVLLSVDKQIIKYDYNKTEEHVSFPNELIFGGSYDSLYSFIGCMKNILIGPEKRSINQITRLKPNIGYEEKMCSMKDLCFPSRPCKNSGRCIQTQKEATCNCTGTDFKGLTCSVEDNSHYMKTCNDYYNAGFKQNGIYKIKPGTSSPFEVKCVMDHSKGPITMIQTYNRNKTFVLNGKDHDDSFYYYQVKYKANKHQIRDLLNSSNFCRQYIRYDCYQSTLSNSNENFRQSQLGLRWYSKSGSVRNYWSGERKEKNGCACSANKNCANSKLLCNCDMRDQKMRFDEGYITDRTDLPISKIRVSILLTNHRSAFQTGHLECGNRIPTTKITVRDTSVTKADINEVDRSTDMTRNGVYHKGNNNNTVVNQSTEKRSFILIDSKLLYIIIGAVVILIVLFMFILIFKKRICCCYQEFKGKPQIVELYKEELTRNNNQNSLQVLNDHLVPFSQGMSTYQVSCSDSSVSTIDPGRYYQEHDSDSYSVQSNLSVPKRGILKIKKDSIITHTRKSDESITSTNNRSKNPLSVFNKNYCQNADSEFNYELDSPETSISPLKQKVLELSTNNFNRKTSGNGLYFHQDSSTSSLSSSSCLSKESELDSDADSNEVFTHNSELEPLTKCTRSKSVRFSDDETTLLRAGFSMERIMRLTFDNEDSGELLFSDEQKTLV